MKLKRRVIIFVLGVYLGGASYIAASQSLQKDVEQIQFQNDIYNEESGKDAYNELRAYFHSALDDISDDSYRIITSLSK